MVEKYINKPSNKSSNLTQQSHHSHQWNHLRIFCLSEATTLVWSLFISSNSLLWEVLTMTRSAEAGGSEEYHVNIKDMLLSQLNT